MARTLNQSVIAGGVYYPAGTSEADVKGDVPDKFWAGAGGGSEAEGYDALSVDELRAKVDRRELEVSGTGKDGNVLKKDLVAALEADDAG